MNPSKEEQKKMIIDMMEMDELSGLYREMSPIVEEKHYNVMFSYKGKSVKVELVNGEDLIKLADIFSNFLTENGIKNRKVIIDSNKEM